MAESYGERDVVKCLDDVTYCSNGACKREIEKGESFTRNKKNRVECRNCFPFSIAEMHAGRTGPVSVTIQENLRNARVRVRNERRLLGLANNGDADARQVVFDLFLEKVESEERALGI